VTPHTNPEGVSWCFEHRRYEPAADYIDFECSPTFLGAYYQMGVTQRRPFERQQNRPTWEERRYVEPNQQDVTNVDSVWAAVQKIQEQIQDIRRMIADDRGRGRQRGTEQREIEL
jgi:hypothetical protein